VAVGEAIASIADRPGSFVEVTNGVRRALTRRFPYAIFFAEEGRVIVILAIKQQAQDPASWPQGV
jgi:toxin ParE1/3/4